MCARVCVHAQAQSRGAGVFSRRLRPWLMCTWESLGPRGEGALQEEEREVCCRLRPPSPAPAA